MAKIQAPRGTHDILPGESRQWIEMERRTHDLMGRFGFQEIRTPMFEAVELFMRGVGEGSDIVRKEMYDFHDKGDRHLSLRPEGTAGVARAAIEHGMLQPGRVHKLYYQGPMFRYDRPAAGRYRQFHQMGAEALGSHSPLADFEIISLLCAWLETMGLQGLTVKLNSVGCPVCRPAYREKLRDFFRPRLERLCGDCKERFEKNPMRILDCKNPLCQAEALGAPSTLDSLGEECRTHLEELRTYLDAGGISYVMDSGLVRGLDYYTKTAFEVHHGGLGAQSALGGGGRYDGLVEEVGGSDCPGVGFSVGLERILLARASQFEMESMRLGDDLTSVDYFVATASAEARPEALRLIAVLRRAGSAEMDLSGASLKSQFKQADRVGARKVIVLGPREIERGALLVRDMASHQETEVSLEEFYRSASAPDSKENG